MGATRRGRSRGGPPAVGCALAHARRTHARTYVGIYIYIHTYVGTWARVHTHACPADGAARRSEATEESVDLRRGRAHVPRPGHTRVLRSQGNMSERDQTGRRARGATALDERLLDGKEVWAVHTPSLSTACLRSGGTTRLVSLKKGKKKAPSVGQT